VSVMSGDVGIWLAFGSLVCVCVESAEVRLCDLSGNVGPSRVGLG
jgi:hypothetical protein